MHFIEQLIQGVIHLEWGPLCVVISAIFWTYQMGRGLVKFFDWLTGTSGSLVKANKLTVSKIEFVRQVLGWCVDNFGLPHKVNRWPHIRIRYYRHKKWGGLYFQRRKEIIVYWASHHTLLDIINTVIHEYQHFLDLRSNKDDLEYAKELQRVGYYENVYEKKARKTADEWEKECYQAMVKKGVIGK